MSVELGVHISALIRNCYNIEVLGLIEDSQLVQVGVRLRPYGKRAPRDVMVWGSGISVEEAMENAIDAAQADKTMPLDWAYRPWDTYQARHATTWR